jgi:hypothetical protein
MHEDPIAVGVRAAIAGVRAGCVSVPWAVLQEGIKLPCRRGTKHSKHAFLAQQRDGCRGWACCDAAQLHVTLGHTTVLAEALYFGTPEGAGEDPAQALSSMVARIGSLSLNVRCCCALLPGNYQRLSACSAPVLISWHVRKLNVHTPSKHWCCWAGCKRLCMCLRRTAAWPLTMARTTSIRRSCTAWRAARQASWHKGKRGRPPRRTMGRSGRCSASASPSLRPRSFPCPVCLLSPS